MLRTGALLLQGEPKARILHAHVQLTQGGKGANMDNLYFEELIVSIEGGFKAMMYRARVPGGWIILSYIGQAGSTVYIPDPEHKWNGKSIA